MSTPISRQLHESREAFIRAYPPLMPTHWVLTGRQLYQLAEEIFGDGRGIHGSIESATFAGLPFIVRSQADDSAPTCAFLP